MAGAPTSLVREVLDFSKDLALVLKETVILGVRHPIKTSTILRGVWRWQELYFATQKQSSGSMPYFVYTDLDQQIPFQPEESRNYNDLIPLLLVSFKEAINHYPLSQMKHAINCFLDANDQAQEVYREYQTIMPRFTYHQQLGLHLVQWIDLPLNCCPSLHVAYSSILYNLSDTFIPSERRTTTKKTLETMANSVLYTKQHAVVDVAFGFLCGKIAFEKHYGNGYHDLTREFIQQQEHHPTIPYHEIKTIYDWGLEQHHQGKNLVQIVGEYFQGQSFPRLPHDQDLRGSYFDTKSKSLQKKNT